MDIIVTQVAHLLEEKTDVELTAEHMNRYPNEFSGGQRQLCGLSFVGGISNEKPKKY